MRSLILLVYNECTTLLYLYLRWLCFISLGMMTVLLKEFPETSPHNFNVQWLTAKIGQSTNWPHVMYSVLSLSDNHLCVKINDMDLYLISDKKIEQQTVWWHKGSVMWCQTWCTQGIVLLSLTFMNWYRLTLDTEPEERPVPL